MNLKTKQLIETLDSFINQFSEINLKHQRGEAVVADAEKTLEAYTAFILDNEYRELWSTTIDSESPEIAKRIRSVRKESAHCVWAMEKYRAKTLIHKKDAPADYFKNVEGCIEKEFGKFVVNENSRILLIGVGAFPMTPLTIAKNTGAKVVGIDIDAEAVAYAKQVLNLLGKDLDIEVGVEPYKTLDFTKEATHIIIASTIPEKLEILRELYEITSDDVVVSMRYGNGFKSLFNYPLIQEQQGAWRQADSIYFDDNVFDVAMFEK